MYLVVFVYEIDGGGCHCTCSCYKWYEYLKWWVLKIEICDED